jgi:L-threonylcarbamoyladenylate synthase
MSEIDYLAVAADILTGGGVVAFPTETVYGLGGNAYDDSAVAKIFEYKNRPPLKPLSICYHSFEKALDDVEADERAFILAEKFLPGPLTIILKRKSSSKISRLCTGGSDTTGIRVPDHRTALDLLSRLPFPLAAPSANKSGFASPTTAKQVSENFEDFKDLFILDGGICSVGTASTVVDLVNNKIVRIGALKAAEIEKVIKLSV